MLRGLGSRTHGASSRTVPGQKTIQVVAVRPVRSEILLVEKTLDPTTKANLVGVFLGADRPTHLVVPATAKNHHPGACEPSGQQPPRPQPARLLLLFTHLPQPVLSLPQLVSRHRSSAYPQFQSCAMALELVESERLERIEAPGTQVTLVRHRSIAIVTEPL